MDLNGDGLIDVLSGSYSPGEIKLFPRLADGSFGPGEVLRTADGKPVLAGRASAVFAFDWDRDGDLDLLVGNIDGEVRLVPQVDGDEGKLAFGEPEILLRSIPGRNAGPTVADWNGDGTPDLIVGCGDGSVRLYPGSGDEGRVTIGEPVELVAKGDWSAGRGVRAKVCATDYNGDGRLDLLLGEYHSVRGPAPEIPESERATMERLRAAQQELSRQVGDIYQTVLAEVRADLEDADPNAVRQEVSKRLMARDDYRGLLDRMREASRGLAKYRTPSTPHGNVWLFLRKPAEPVATGD